MLSLAFKTWVKDLTGHDITANNIDIAISVLKQQAKKSGVNVAQYCQNLMRGLIPPQNFIDNITTHESYFFRHQKTMLYIINELFSGWLGQGIKPRVLSAPCAQGEEPYSLAMLLAEHNINANQVSIYGTDIASSCIKAAKEAKYSPYTLRKTPDHIKRKYFIKQKQHNQSIAKYRLSEMIKAYQPGFHQINLLQGLKSQFPAKFHVIFCQNLLIYMNKQDQIKLLRILHDHLEPDGWLFVDITEVQIVSQLFERKGHYHMSGFQRKDFTNTSSAKSFSQSSSDVRSEKILETRSQIRQQIKLPGLVAANETIKPSLIAKNETRSAAKKDLFSQAQRAYDIKQLDQAITLFEQVLTQGTTKKALTYLGLAKAQADLSDNFSALESAEQALNLCAQLNNKQQAEIHGILGIIKKNKGMKQAASGHFEQVQNLDPTSPVGKLK